MNRLSKRCSKCQVEKDLDEFYRSTRYKDGRQHRCKDCSKRYTQEATAAWRRENPASQKASTRRTKAKQKYGVSLDTIHKMLTSQGGRCAICQKPISFTADDKRNKPHVDHDHQSGKLRSLLCLTCNTGLGMFGDSIHLIELAKQYLIAHSGQPERLSELASDSDDAIVRSHGN